jgi:SSS family solute:Na+ symporter
VYTYLPSFLIAAYFASTLLIAIRSFRKQRTSNDFLNETGNLPTWVATLSFLAANCGALEIVGLSGVAARYGVQAFHFYWIGAIPAMIFVSFVVLPVYQRSGVHSVPEYLERRFGRKLRLLNAAALLGSTCLTAGISLYALALDVCDLCAGCGSRGDDECTNGRSSRNDADGDPSLLHHGRRSAADAVPVAA